MHSKSLIIVAILTTLLGVKATNAQSNLLESVKRNPQEAIAICSRFRELNSKGISASSKESIKEISQKRNLNETDSEILSMYIRGLHCPDVV
tara:strand:- start:16368 stop:16643 length:276 start_codon:yes stop_codon:yes gene_type:complete